MQELMMVVLVPITEKIQILVGVSSGVDPANNNTNVQSCNGVKGNNFFHQQIATPHTFYFPSCYSVFSVPSYIMLWENVLF